MSHCSSPARYCYSVYGVRVTSDFPFEFPSDDEEAARGVPLAHVEFVEGVDRDFQPFARPSPSDTGFVCQPLPGGPTYLRWPHWYEFSVAADGSRIACRPLHGCDRSVLQNFLFGQALAVALVHQGLEPLHAAVVRLDEGAIGFLGDCTFGKSTLLATFLHAGHRVLTDDLLILDRRAGDTVAQPGSGRIKLLPDSASQFLDDADGGTLLNPLTTKRSFRVDASRRQPSALPLRQLFVLPDPDERDRITSIEIRPASRAEMVRELLKNTFTDGILNRERLVRQFAHAAQVAAEVDGFWLRYPSGLHHLHALRQAIVEHVHRGAMPPSSTTETENHESY
jgi:hypothetical protein